MLSNIKGNFQGFNYERVIYLLLALTIFPHSVIRNGINVSLSDLYLLLVLAVFLFVKKFDFKIPKQYTYIIFAYLALGFLSIIWAEDGGNVIAPALQLFEFMFFGAIVFYNLKEKEQIVKILKYYVFTITIVAVLAILIVLIKDIKGPLYVLGYHKNALGAFISKGALIAVGLLYLSRGKLYRRFYMFSIAVNGIVLFLTMSRGAMLGLMAGLVVFFVLINQFKVKTILKYGAIALVVGVTAVSVIAPEYVTRMMNFDKFSSAYSRVLIYQDAVDKIGEKPVLGHGLGNYQIELPQINFKQDDPNNVFLLNLVELGFVGLVLFVLVLTYIVRVALRNWRDFESNPRLLILNGILFSCFINQLVHIQVDVSWVRGTGLFMFAMVGMLLTLSDRTENINLHKFRFRNGGSK